MNGITYFRLKSDYPGDYTKNCALNGTEVDNNFYVLEGRDVESIAVDGKDIVVTLLNGEKRSASGVLDFVKPEEIGTTIVNIEFDKTTGILKVTNTEGDEQYIEGFATDEIMHLTASTDNTLIGNGQKNSPLGISPIAKTGQYKPVKSFINISEGGVLPTCGNALGDRYVTCEDISDYGYLYSYRAIRDIACAIKKSGWRIPTKADWDDLLNAVEPCQSDKDHDMADKNKYLGKWAGKLLKSKDLWKEDGGCDCYGSCQCNGEKKCNCKGECTCGGNTCIDYTNDNCEGTKECETTNKCEKETNHKGLDAYGFRVVPAGYVDDGCNYGYFKERAEYWTATTDTNNTKAYMKRFQYNKDGVYQDVIPSNYHLSLRLVKDYDGRNYNEVEEIMDLEYPTLLLPSESKGKSIWTACNFACANASLRPMIPNDGQGITYTRHYFVNEWDGFGWIRNEMKEGDSIIVANAPMGKKMVEYRIVGDDFVNIDRKVYEDVMSDVAPVIENVEKKLSDRIDSVEASVIAEREERIIGDKKNTEAIEEEVKRATDVEAQLWNGIAQEATARETVDNDQWKAIENEAVNRETVDNEQWTALNNESTIREQIDNKQWDAINAEREERIARDKEIEGKIFVKEGSEFNVNTGVLTIKCIDETNDINIQLGFNFGEF